MILSMDKYYLEWHDSASNTGGVKAKEDANKILNANGYQAIEAPVDRSAKLKYVYNFKHVVAKLRGVIVIQFPTGKPFMLSQLIKGVKSNPNLKLVLLIHDLETLRVYNKGLGRPLAKVKELNKLKLANGLIVLNKKMEDWLVKKGINVPMVTLDLWDYLYDGFFLDEPYRKTVGYAGNLHKAKFLEDFSLEHKLVLYGANAEELHLGKGVAYQGCYSPDELPNKLDFDFGLVWDGDSVTECSGVYGNYLKYNTPHKISLYLNAGIPVIVWRKSALAGYIAQHDLGILIDSLADIDGVLDNLDELTYYKKYRYHVREVGTKLRQGKYLSKALAEILIKISKEDG